MTVPAAVAAPEEVLAPIGLRLESVSRRYATAAGTIEAVQGVDLVVAPGCSLAITGPSGCGKSTLLGLIGGLDTPSGGRVRRRAPRALRDVRRRPLPGPADRAGLRLPVRQPAALPHRDRERQPAAGHPRGGRRMGAQPSPARRARPGRPGRPPAGPALRRAAPAGGRGPGPRPPPPDDPGRRADGLPRRRHAPRRCSRSSSVRSRPRAPRSSSSPTTRRSPPGWSARSRCATAASSPTPPPRVRASAAVLGYAWRDLVRNPRRTLATLAGVVLGVGLFAGVLFFIDGSGATLTSRAVAPLAIDMQRVLTSPLGRRLTFTEELSAPLPRGRGRAGDRHAHGRQRGAEPGPRGRRERRATAAPLLRAGHDDRRRHAAAGRRRPEPAGPRPGPVGPEHRHGGARRAPSRSRTRPSPTSPSPTSRR